jgi:hypothetical protein
MHDDDLYRAAVNKNKDSISRALSKDPGSLLIDQHASQAPLFNPLQMILHADQVTCSRWVGNYSVIGIWLFMRSFAKGILATRNFAMRSEEHWVSMRKLLLRQSQESLPLIAERLQRSPS